MSTDRDKPRTLWLADREPRDAFDRASYRLGQAIALVIVLACAGVILLAIVAVLWLLTVAFSWAASLV